MFSAADARKATREAAERILQENLEKKIKEACAKGENHIFAHPTKLQREILKEAGYRLFNAFDGSMQISWEE